MIIALDTECGGIGDDTSLLSLYMVVIDDNFEYVDELDLYLKPDDGIYHLTAQGMAVNKIDIVEHDCKAITYSEAGGLVRKFIRKYGNHTKLVPLGHNVKFDIIKVTNNLIKKGLWDQFVEYRTLDTGTISCFLMDCGILSKISLSLENLATHLKIKPNKSLLHTAQYDTWLSVDIYKKLKSLTLETLD